MAFTRTWSKITPADTDLANVLGAAVRNLREDVEERMEIDHEWTDADDGGKHKKITLLDPLAGKPTAVADEGYIYTKDVNSKAELHWEDEDGNELVLTSAGKVPAAGLGALANDAALLGKEVGDTERDLIQVGGGDLIEVGDVAVDLDIFTSKRVRVFDGSTNFPFFNYGSVIMSPGFMIGLRLSHAVDADHDISMSAGTAMDTTAAFALVPAVILVKKIDVNWVAGTAAGGFPSGLTLTADTSYRFFVIMHLDGTVDAGWDTSSTAANLLTDSGYTFFRQVGYFTTDASANIALNIGQDFGFGSPYDAYYEQTGLAIPTSGPFDITIEHGFASVPKKIEISIVCISGDAGYSVDDVIILGSITTSSSQGLTAWKSATEVAVSFGSNSIFTQVIHKTDGSRDLLDDLKWLVTVRAWK